MPTATKPIVWNAVLTGALNLPGVRIDRTEFLYGALSRYVSAEQLRRAIETSPSEAGIDAATIRKASEATIRLHHAGVTATSALAGLPGGWWMAGTIPTDMAQYFWHVIVVLQKLAYLHGWPVLLDHEREIDDDTKMVLTLFVGVMLGAHGASEALRKLAASLAQEAVTRIPRAAMSRYALFRAAKEVAKWLGISLTKRRFAEWVGRAVPIAGGLVAGGVTWYAFRLGTDRLLQHLEMLPPAPEQPVASE